MLVPRAPVLLFETGVSPVTAGGMAAGWVTGNPASLAPNTAAECLFDLGPDWRQYGLAQFMFRPVGPSSGFDSVRITGNDTGTPTINNERLLSDVRAAAGLIIFASVLTSGGGAVFIVRPAGRYLSVFARNADASNATGAAKITLTAYPSL